MHKYVGRIVTIIYRDGKGAFTKRTVRIVGVGNGRILTYDLDKRAPRVFEVDRILALQPVARHA